MHIPSPPPTGPGAAVAPAPVATEPPAASAAVSAEPPRQAHHWTYAGESGPAAWGDLEADFATCKTGTKQSPIDIPAKPEAGGKDAPKLSIDYKPLALAIQNNGHTVTVPGQASNHLTIGKKTYDLVQLHFHSPSEHTVAGKSYDLEMHLVHKAADGELAVLGVLFAKGETPKQLGDVFAALPKEVAAEPQVIAGKTVDLAPLVALKDGYWHYQGSLTTPPCSEGVLWFVEKKTFTIADADVARYRELFGGPTNRAPMPLGDRKVLDVKP